MQLVVELVRPLRVVPPLLDRPQIARLHFRDDERAWLDRPHAVGELGEDVARRVVEHRVHRVEPETVDAVVAHPKLRVLDRPLTNTSLRVIERVAPERLVPVGEVRAEGAQRFVARADVVVDDVEHNAKTLVVRCVDEACKPLRPAVGLVRRRRVQPVVAPAARAGKRRDRHHLDRGHAELRERAQVPDRRVERPLLGERPDVELIEHELVECRTHGLEVELRRVEHARDAAHAVRLPTRGRVGALDAVDDEPVVVAVSCRRLAAPEALLIADERVLVTVHANCERGRRRRPHLEVHDLLVAGNCAEHRRDVTRGSLARTSTPRAAAA